MSGEDLEYTPDGKSDELFALLTTFGFFELSTPNYIVGHAPDGWRAQVEDAVDFKSRGEYLRAAQILTGLMQDAGTAYTKLTNILFEIELCSGFITAGVQRALYLIQKLDRANLSILTTGYTDDLRRLSRSFASEESLRSYLSELCGNSNYFLPTDFDQLKGQFDALKQDELYGEQLAFLERNYRGATLQQALSRATPDTTKADSVVPLAMNDDETVTFTAHESFPFTPDLKWKEIGQLVKTLIEDTDEVSGSGLMRKSADKYPEAWAPQIRQAVDLKRRGHFLASARIYEDLSRQSGIFYTGIIAGMYKTVAASGALLSGNYLLTVGFLTLHRDPQAVANAAGMPSAFEDHESRLIKSTKTETELEAYLRDICGNVSYKFPRDYEAAVGELKQHFDDLQALTADLEKANGRSTGGCYIATAVYGSHDAPAVIILRRFRDDTLATSAAGRCFIRAYYAVSPTLADRLESTPRLNRMIRRVLDFVVQKLEERR